MMGRSNETQHIGERQMIDLAILGVLAEHDMHGYEIRKRLEELSGSRLAISFGSIYPTLAKLERLGLVKAVTHEQISPPATPMSGSLTGELAAFRANPGSLAGPKRGGRGKKVYGITNRGHERLHDLLVGPEASDRDFAVRIAFCHHLTPAERLDLFEQRRADLVKQRKQQERRSRGVDGKGKELAPAAPGPNRYLLSLIEHETEVASADLAWLDRLIESERIAAAEATSRNQEVPET